MNAIVSREYHRLRDKGWNASAAYRSAKTHARWRVAECDGLVRIVLTQDEDAYDVSYVDTWDDASHHEKERIKKDILSQVARDGVWTITGEYRQSDDDDWTAIDSVGGFVGDDWRDSGYDVDVMLTTLDALDEARLRAAMTAYAVPALVSAGWQGP